MLTDEEIKWLAKLQRVLDKCPSDRLGFFTTGDPTIHVYDFSKEKEINQLMNANDRLEFCNAVRKTGAELATVVFPNSVHSTSG